ncbi:uncharacterized protein I303_101711 [Kwoniella dejecticola CBS 10117]|uniref:Zn(2)-C6 fungal-type domain-containing protein n=1 Tax=Kwoniella dejecticola CBS 10117 TaxID=1296121 RepID=A0A1A6ACZ3_9TREE|nr:uncharacterized protein I303_02153 [Kwoniella dejecticola CBS 10117]OBR87937.1 hypothetical protein I303_02153 [Kwoniella dejecticola CBS 10117]
MSYHPYALPSDHPMMMDNQYSAASSSSPSGIDPYPSNFAGTSFGGIGKWQGGNTNGNTHKAAPVKAACLSCRNKKAKCDGNQPVCGQCARKNLECVFVKSRRGGARKRRPVMAPTALAEYLKKLDFLLTAPALDHGPSTSSDDSDFDGNEDTTEVVKQFSSREEVFQNYYKDVHQYVTVMPPKALLQTILPTLLPNSPFLLAVQAILVLAPHSKDPNPNSSRSKRIRQAASVAFADQAVQLVESLVANGQLNLECVQATTIIALWEWASRGSISKNRERASYAVTLAMQLGLHELDKHTPSSVPVGPNENGRMLEGADWQQDMARRTWWTTFVSQLTAALVSGNQPIIGPDDPGVYVHYPICSETDHSWSNFLETVKSTIKVFNLVTSVYFPQLGSDQTSAGFFSPSDNQNTQHSHEDAVRQKMYDVDKQVMDLIKQAEATAIIELVPGGEEEVGRNQQLQARLGLAVVHIHIHRWQAFPEVSLFSKKICGLPQAPEMIPADDFSSNTGTSDYQTSAGNVTTAYDPTYNGSDPASTNGSFQNYSQPNQPYDQTQQSGLYAQIGSSNGFPGTGQEMVHQYTQDLNLYDPNEIYEYGVDDMWAPEAYPDALPAPWFSYPGGAAQLYAPTLQAPNHYPEITASIIPISPTPPRSSVPPSETGSAHSRRPSEGSAASVKPHKAWGVDDKSDKVLPPPELQQLDVFPPGISLARCATAAHTIVRLEVLHRSAVMAMWDGPPKWPPFCSCGLVTGAYAFLLLALAVQAENTFSGYTNSRSEEVEALLTNVKVILAGLEAYGTMWAGIDAMAGEVRAALEAATRLPFEVSAQIENGTASPSTQGGQQE